MTALVSTIDIARPPDEVFAYGTDATRFSEWQKDVVSVRLLDDRPPGVGSRFATTRQIGRSRRTMIQEITHVAPNRNWVASGVDGPVRVEGKIDIEPTEDGRHSRVTITLSFEGRGIGRLIVPLFIVPQARKGSPYSYRNLKQRRQLLPPGAATTLLRCRPLRRRGRNHSRMDINQLGGSRTDPPADRSPTHRQT